MTQLKDMIRPYTLANNEIIYPQDPREKVIILHALVTKKFPDAIAYGTGLKFFDPEKAHAAFKILTQS